MSNDDVSGNGNKPNAVTEEPPILHQNAPIIFADSVGTYMVSGDVLRVTLTTEIDMVAPGGGAFTQLAVVGHLRLQANAVHQLRALIDSIPLLLAPAEGADKPAN